MRATHVRIVSLSTAVINALGRGLGLAYGYPPSIEHVGPNVYSGFHVRARLRWRWITFRTIWGTGLPGSSESMVSRLVIDNTLFRGACHRPAKRDAIHTRLITSLLVTLPLNGPTGELRVTRYQPQADSIALMNLHSRDGFPM